MEKYQEYDPEEWDVDFDFKGNGELLEDFECRNYNYVFKSYTKDAVLRINPRGQGKHDVVVMYCCVTHYSDA